MKFALSTLVIGVALAALTVPASAQDAGITVYNAQHESLTQDWADAFTAETGIAVTKRRNGSCMIFGMLRPHRRKVFRKPRTAYAGRGKCFGLRLLPDR